MTGRTFFFAMKKRDFLSLFDFSPAELDALIQRAIRDKQAWLAGQADVPLRGKTMGMIFEKSSTRTRVSFEAGMNQLGGHALFLSPRDTQLGRGEPIEDTARVLSRMVDIVMIRNDSQAAQERFAACSLVPVINGLSERAHPCQLLADVMTYVEERGSIKDRTVAWIGDGNNMCNSYIAAASQFGFKLRIACPAAFAPDPGLIARAGDAVSLTDDPRAAAQGADMLVTDVWASMGQESDQAQRAAAFKNYQVTEDLLRLAAPDALFMHCLPAHRGEEVSAGVIDGPQSVVWDEAGNRLHAQKALILSLLNI